MQNQTHTHTPTITQSSHHILACLWSQRDTEEEVTQATLDPESLFCASYDGDRLGPWEANRWESNTQLWSSQLIWAQFIHHACYRGPSELSQTHADSRSGVLQRCGGVNVSFPPKFIGTLTGQVSYVQLEHPAASLTAVQARRPASTHWTHIVIRLGWLLTPPNSLPIIWKDTAHLQQFIQQYYVSAVCQEQFQAMETQH